MLLIYQEFILRIHREEDKKQSEPQSQTTQRREYCSATGLFSLLVTRLSHPSISSGHLSLPPLSRSIVLCLTPILLLSKNQGLIGSASPQPRYSAPIG